MNNFEHLNDLLKALPELWHWAASGVVIASLAHLILKFVQVWCRTRWYMRIYFFTTYMVVAFVFFSEYSQPDLHVLDAYFPLYLIYYLHTLIILQSRFWCSFPGVLAVLKKLFDFNSIPQK